MTNRIRHSHRAEVVNQLFDVLKHVTTLSTGSLLLMSGLLEKVFKEPAWKELAAGSFVLFAISICTAVFAMLSFSLYTTRTRRSSTGPLEAGIYALVGALSAFGIAISTLAVFVAINFLR